MAVALSEAAAKQVKELKQAQNLPETVFLRMGVKGGGCSGMSYTLEFDTEIGPHDKSSRSTASRSWSTRRATCT